MIDARFVWMPRPDDMGTDWARFRAPYSKTLKLLARELEALFAVSVVVQAGFEPDQVRNDGWPLARAVPQHGAVQVEFCGIVDESVGVRSFVFRSVRFKKYEDNVRAIALTLEHLRDVDRFGVVAGHQYDGFKRLSGAESAPPTTVAEARAFLRGLAKPLTSSGPIQMLDAVWLLRKKHHPDAGGSHETFVRIGQAAELLRTAGITVL